MQFRASSALSTHHQRIARFELRKARKISIRRPQFSHPVFDADGGNARVVKLAGFEICGAGQVEPGLGMTDAAVQQTDVRRAQPLCRLDECIRQRCRFY